MSNTTATLTPVDPAATQPLESEAPARLSGLWPVPLLAASLLGLLCWQLVLAYHQRNILKSQIGQRQQLVQQRQELVRQRQESVQQSQKVQEELKRLVDSVIKFAKNDPDAKALLAKYNITPK